ncbi:MAG: lysylphosphatidylglycerol synthase domain-containing protein [Cyanobacteria bacterium P01_F01_bin.150]
MKRLKASLKWFILGGVFFFLFQTLQANWKDISTIRVTAAGWACIVAATGITLLAHIWSGWVWGWILGELNHPQAMGSWSVITYLKTNIAKYLPGNIWHFYGRVMTAKSIDIPIEASTVSVVMEALLMAASALLVGLLSSQQLNIALQLLCLIVGLLSVHPRLLNRLLKRLKVGKLQSVLRLQNLKGVKRQKAEGRRQKNPPLAPPRRGIGVAQLPNSSTPQLSNSPKSKIPTGSTQLKRYPFLPLFGELIFLGFRSLGFVAVLMALTSLNWSELPAVLSGFSLAWMLGLVIPGAPGGIGVFEATAIALLGQSTTLSTGIILSAVALYRLVSTLAEAIGAGVAWLDEQQMAKRNA